MAGPADRSRSIPGKYSATVPGASSVKIAVFISRQITTLLRGVQFAQAFGQPDLDPPLRHLDVRADIFGQRDHQLAFRRVHLQQWCADAALTREEYVVDRAKHTRRLLQRTSGRSQLRLTFRHFEYGSADQVAYKIPSSRKFHSLIEWKKDFVTTERFGARDRGRTSEMENPRFRVIAVDPEVL